MWHQAFIAVEVHVTAERKIQDIRKYCTVYLTIVEYSTIVATLPVDVLESS
jgi:hypothetical protein